MMESEPIDLSALDPERDPEHWHRTVQQALRRIDPMLRERGTAPGPLGLIASWRRPLLAAAAIAVLALVPVEVALERQEPHRERIENLVELSTSGMLAVSKPSGSELLRALGVAGSK